MKIISLKTGKSMIHASPMSLIIHRQTFNTSLIEDFDKAFSFGEIIELSTAQKILWTLSKTADFKLVDYDQWVMFLSDDTNWKIPLQQEINEKIFFESVAENTEDAIEPDNSQDWEVSILVNAKRMGLNIEELNLLTMKTFIDYQNMYIGDDNKPRKATQADIDALLG